MNTRDFTIAFELAIGLFALYLFGRRLVRLMRPNDNRRDEDGEKDDEDNQPPNGSA